MRVLFLCFTIFAWDVLFAQQIDCNKTTPTSQAFFDSLQNNTAVPRERLLNAGKLRVLGVDYIITQFTVIIDGARVDLAEETIKGNTFSLDALRLIKMTVGGDLVNIDCIIGKNNKGNSILCKPFYFIIE